MQSFGNPCPPKLNVTHLHFCLFVQHRHGMYSCPKYIFYKSMLLGIHYCKSSFNPCLRSEAEIIKKVIKSYIFCLTRFILYKGQLMNDRCVFEFHLKLLLFQSACISQELKIMLEINTIFMLIFNVLGTITLCE